MENILINTNIISTLFYIAVALISIVMYHKSNADYNSKTKKIHSIASFVYIYKYIQLSTFAVCIVSIWVNHRYLFELYTNNDMLAYTGIAISGLAITLFAISRFSLGNNYSPCYDQRKPKTIISSGLYKYVRHPIYSSNVLLLVGTFIISGSYLMLVNILILSLFYAISAYREEKYLINNFTYYKAYSKNTGMFIPRYKK